MMESVYEWVKTENSKKNFKPIASFILNYLLFFNNALCISLSCFAVFNSKKWELLCVAFLLWIAGDLT